MSTNFNMAVSAADIAPTLSHWIFIAETHRKRMTEEGADEARATIDGMRQIKFGLDNVYRLFSVENNTFPEALRGRWENSDTLVLEDIVLGQQIEIISQIRFSGETLHIDWEEVTSGTKVELSGTLNADAQ